MSDNITGVVGDPQYYWRVFRYRKGEQYPLP